MSDKRGVRFSEEDDGAAGGRGAGGAGTEEELPGAGLSVQTLDQIRDRQALHPLMREIMSRQATINIGTIGHVAHGKSTVVKAISGVKTIRFKNELVRNITIKLGYANAKIYRGLVPGTGVGGAPARYTYEAQSSSFPDEYVLNEGTPEEVKMELVRHVSFVDCPGHDILMATMLNGAAVMDAAMLLVAGNEPCPQPQTSEHLAAVEIMQLKNIIILQNKIDLVKEEAAKLQHDQIKAFVAGTVAGNAPVIPISAQLKYNIDIVCKNIATKVPVPVRDFSSSPRMIIIRSFDVNKPGEEAERLQGGVAGGSILRGVLSVGDEVEIRPGITSRDSEGHVRCTPIRSKIVSLKAEKNELQYAVPGGLIGVGLQVDPTLTRADRLVGQVLGHVGSKPDGSRALDASGKPVLPGIYSEINVSFYLLRRLLGVRAAEGEKAAKVQKLTKGEMLMVNIGSTSTGGRVVAVEKDKGDGRGDTATLALTQPVCTESGEKIALSRRVEGNWRLIGWGKISSGVELVPENGVFVEPKRTEAAE